MKTISVFLVALASAFSYSSSHGQSNSSLEAKEFARKLQQSPQAMLVDVRTQAEYTEGHIPKARNIDWNGSDFEKQIVKLDKSKPVFVYCLGGGRSASAARKMRSIGFKEVIELRGGFTQWKASQLPITTQ